MERNHFPPSDFGIGRLASQNQVMIFTKSTCCMCHTIKTLFGRLGIKPTVCEIDHDPNGREMEKVLTRLGCKPAVPAVFIGGKLVGGPNEVMTRHLSGTLIPFKK
ncbi:hypothetical protein MKW98_031713 [Papaver atlanticum]|uniref:Glutaredoxin domain-containing protein n=1 Tax=Papaver atlanticum TaxID=357466 RepID=A0AAD4S746_9MAGN|nr:hypothetical protein MKW98_031713 [Papaver atlanticum]